MYQTLALMLIIILPLPVLLSGNRSGEAPFRSIVKGAAASAVGIAAVFLIAYITGGSVLADMKSAIDGMAGQLAHSDRLAESFGLSDLSTAERAEKYAAAYEGMMQMVPASLMITAVIVSWIEGLIVGRRKGPDGRPKNPVPPLRELVLPRGAVFGWLFIIVAAWICRLAGASFGNTLTGNVDMLFEFTFGLQGMSLILLFFHMKKVPKAVPVLIVIICWLTSLGQNILFFVGLIDIMFGLRRRIKSR